MKLWTSGFSILMLSTFLVNASFWRHPGSRISLDRPSQARLPFREPARDAKGKWGDAWAAEKMKKCDWLRANL
jgi:hypothetical protein